LHIANLLSLALFMGFVLYYGAVAAPRAQVQQLDPKNLSYCLIQDCPRIQGLELSDPEASLEALEDKPFGAMLELDFTNHELLEGTRELWLRVESSDGRLLEMASVEIELSLKTRTIAEFLLVSRRAELLAGNLYLGY
jgi:hypothetical protein